MAIVPDTKNWTWVLDRRCPDCGFDTQSFAREHMGAMLRDNGAAWQRLLTDRPDVRDRPTPDKWSLLEYGCHVRDVFRIFDERLRLMLEEDEPHFANWDQDESAIAERYAEQDPNLVAAEIGPAVASLSDRYDSVAGAQWERAGLRNDGSAFTVESLARYLMHDPVHHLWDVGG